MSSKTVCRLCLATKVSMHSLAHSPLKNIYEKLTGISLNAPQRPLMACYICYSLLKKCDDLLLRSVRADRVLTQLLNSGLIITEEVINTIDRETYQLNDPLTVTPVELMSIVSSGHNFMGMINNEESIPLCAEDVEVELKCLDSEERIEDAEREDDKVNEDTVHVYVKCEGIDGETAVPENVSFKTEDDGDIMQNKSDDAENSDLTVVLETAGNESNDLEGPAEKHKRMKTQDRTTGKQNITKMQRKHITVKKPSNKNISTLKNAKKVVTQILKDTSRCDTTTNSNVDTSTKHLTSTIYRLLQHIDDKSKKNKQNNVEISAPECSTSQQSFNETVEKNTESHDQMYRIECDVCQRRFAYKKYLVKHLRTHFRENPFECKICQQGFNNERILKRHVKKHTQAKVLECPTCSRTFTKQNALNKHLELHNKEKIFKCAICQRSFTYEFTLRKHFKSHWRETF